MKRFACLAAVAIALLGVPDLLPTVAAFAQTEAPTGIAPKQRPRISGRAYKLTIDSSPQQAVVYWDAAATPAPRDYGIAGYTPLTLVVPRGSVRVIVERKGFRTLERDIYIAKPESLLVTLEKAAQPARLDLVAGSDGGATGAEVSVDGVVRGPLPNSFGLAAGRHNLEVKKAGWKTLTKWIDLAEDERRTVEIVLERAEQAPATPLGVDEHTRATLRVQATVPDAEVFLDGATLGKAPVDRNDLVAGKHELIVRKEGCEDFRREVYLFQGQPVALIADLRNVGKVRFFSSPPGAQLSIDGEP